MTLAMQPTFLSYLASPFPNPAKVHMALLKLQSSKTLQTKEVHLLGNIPYYFTLYFLQNISPQIKI
jgi:hypothetical protein